LPARAVEAIMMRCEHSQPETLRVMEAESPEGEPTASIVPFRPATAARVSFDRRELSTILNLYGRKVSEGEWRDYAIDFLKDIAVFSIYRRTSEMPLYRIVKNPELARKQGAYSVTTTTGLILKRGHDLERVLKVLDKPVKLVR
jgi:hypothetical protein